MLPSKVLMLAMVDPYLILCNVKVLHQISQIVTVSEKNRPSLTKSSIFKTIFISHLMGFVANDSLLKIQQKFLP